MGKVEVRGDTLMNKGAHQRVSQAGEGLPGSGAISQCHWQRRGRFN